MLVIFSCLGEGCLILGHSGDTVGSVISNPKLSVHSNSHDYSKSDIFRPVALCLCGKGMIVARGGYKGDFSQKVPAASPVSNRTNASWLPHRSTAGQG